MLSINANAFCNDFQVDHGDKRCPMEVAEETTNNMGNRFQAEPYGSNPNAMYRYGGRMNNRGYQNNTRNNRVYQPQTGGTNTTINPNNTNQ